MSSRKLLINSDALDGFKFWLQNDRKVVNRIMGLIDEILRDPFVGKGKPEPLKHELKGYWSRRVTEKHRLIYSVTDETVVIISCRFHYKQ